MATFIAERAKETLQNWLIEDGYQIGQTEDQTADFHINITNPATRLTIEAVKPKTKPDMIVLAAGARLTPNQATRLKEISEKRREEFLWEMKFTLLASQYSFQFLPPNTTKTVDQVIVSQDMWYDGLTKHNFMTAFEKVTNGLLFVVWKFAKELGMPNEPKEPSYAG